MSDNKKSHKPLNILFVHERFGALAGAEANAFITGSELSARGHKVGILHGPGTGKQEDRWDQAFPFRYALQKSGNVAIVEQALNDFRPDAVYVHKMADLDVIQTLVDSGVPLVRMVHDHDIYCMRSYRYNVATREICNRPVSGHCVFPCMGNIARNREGGFPLKWQSYADKKREVALNREFDRMVVVTKFMREQLLINGFDADRIEIHAPVPRNVDASIKSTFSDRNLIVYAGQIVRGKGVDMLIRSLARMTVPFECVILGDGNHRASCEKLSRNLGLEDRVHFKGFVPQEELKDYYRGCSAIALSSVWPEPIATIGLEVMRYGLPVVAFDAGGISDWLLDGHNGFLAPWMDVDAFANSLDTLLRDKQKAREMGENGRKLVTQRYEFESYISDLENMFHQVVKPRIPAPPLAMAALSAVA